ncbi:MAG: ScyD/ScyE family protein [Bacteroidota bacterium]
MKRFVYQCVIIVLALLIYGCSDDETILPEEEVAIPVPEEVEEVPEDPIFPDANHNGFTGAIFDLEATPEGDLLVADAGAGIASCLGGATIPLLGVSNIAITNGGDMLALKGAPDADDTVQDIGQGLYQISDGTSEFLVNLFNFDLANNPDGGEIGSNPYSVLSLNGNTALIADAGANDLLRVDGEGNVELVAVFPTELVSTANVQSLVECPNPSDICNLPEMIPAEAVPTAVAVGPDGYYYVGELKGFPAPTGESRIWKVAPDANGTMCGTDPACVIVFDGGFTSIIDMVFGADGRLYVAEFDAQSWFALEVGGGEGGVIKSCDVTTMECTTIATGIPMLTAIAFDESGVLWATRDALIPELAEVFRVME